MSNTKIRSRQGRTLRAETYIGAAREQAHLASLSYGILYNETNDKVDYCRYFWLFQNYLGDNVDYYCYFRILAKYQGEARGIEELVFPLFLLLELPN